MISTSIDGSVGGANQFIDLLSLVSNAPVYEARIKALQEATAQHKAYVDAVAPASEILKLREEARAIRADAVQTAQKAKEAADQVLADANAQKDALLKAAEDNAAQLRSEAKAVNAEAKAKLEEAQQAADAATKAKQDADAAIAKAQAQEQAAAKAQADADAAKADAQAAKADLIAKHKAFIESL